MSDVLTDEQAAAIWGGGDTSSIAGFEAAQAEPVEKTDAQKADEARIAQEAADKLKQPPIAIKEEDITNAFADDGGDDNKEPPAKEGDDNKAQQVIDKKAGKPTDLMSLIDELLEEDVLLGEADPNDETKIIRPKNKEEAKALLKANLAEIKKTASDSAKEEFKKSYSPQIQAVLQYADQGAQSATELMSLLGAIKEAEDTTDYDVSKAEGQINIITETLKARGLKDKFIQSQINILKDLGGDKLKETAEELQPELEEIKSKKVETIINEQADKKREAEKASRVYTQSIQEVLNKDTIGGVKLDKADKYKLYEALALPKYTSLNGKPTNAFVKTLEELQFGENKNYEHFLRIVHLAVDPKGFDEKYKTTLTSTIAEDTEKKLRSSKTLSPNSQGGGGDSRGNASQGRKSLSRSSEFVNPYA